MLSERQVYNHVLWSYAVKHDLPAHVQVFLQHADDFVRQCGPDLNSPLLKIDPVIRHLYQHLDYRPLVNARAHRLGQRRQIVNDRLLQQYRSLLSILSYRRDLGDDELMAVTYYMLLQDRIEEALAFFQRVKPDALASRLQYDYFTAYLDFYSDDPKLAEPIVQQYANYPVDHWRKAFQEIGQQLAEIHGQKLTVVNPEDPQQAQTGRAASEASLDFQVEAKKITIRYQNLTQARINYYIMDIELLFSRNPFVQQYTGQFSTIRPNLTANVELPADANSLDVPLPESLHNSNVLIEICGGGQDPFPGVLRQLAGCTVERELRSAPGAAARDRGTSEQGVREGVCPHAGRQCAVLQGRIHRPARAIRLHLAQHEPVGPGGSFLVARAER